GDRRVDPAARLRHPLDLDDHGLVVEVLQLDLELGEGARLLHQVVAADVAFLQQHVEAAGPPLGRGRRNLLAAAGGGVRDAGAHVADGGVDHETLPYQLDLTRPGIWPWDPRSRSVIRLILSLR